MELYTELIKDAESLRRACEGLSREKALGFDTETTELDPRRGELRLVQFSTGKEAKIIDLRGFSGGSGLNSDPSLQPLRTLLEDPKVVKVAHNARFDAKWVRFHLGCEPAGMFDTYLASLLIAAGDTERRHSLADAAQFFLSMTLDKSEQVSDWSAKELSQSQLEYAARDAAIMLPLYQETQERLARDGLARVAELEFGCLMPVAEMELTGFYLDEGRWRAQLEKVKKTQAAAAGELQGMLSAGVAQASLFGRAEINLDSQQQVAGALANLGVPMPETTRAWQLQPLAEEYPVVGKLLEYRAAQKAITSYGENILEFIEPTTGRIHADFRQIGAPTGRFSCSNPNLQQIPHGPEYRSCFRAPEGRKLVIADYSQIELRILAAFSKDQNFLDAFASGQDFHSATAAQVFGVKPEEVTAEQRIFAKRLNFGVVYGIGASRFAMMTGLSQSDAENTLRRYFTTYRGLDSYLRDTAERAIEERVLTTASGRMVRFRFDEKDRGQVAAAKRYARNMPIQGTSADILKRALRLLHDSIRGTSAKLVNIVHDEIVVECDTAEAEEIAVKLQTAMESAATDLVSNIPVKADAHIADEWAK
jgi:DNA polymerase I